LRIHRFSSVVLCLLAGSLVVASMAWACVKGGEDMGFQPAADEGSSGSSYSAPRQKASSPRTFRRSSPARQPSRQTTRSFSRSGAQSPSTGRGVAHGGGGGSSNPAQIRSTAGSKSSAPSASSAASAGGRRASAGKGGASRGARRRTGLVNRSGEDFFAASLASRDGAQMGGRGRGTGSLQRSAVGDLWSGFGRGKRLSLVPSQIDPAVPASGLSGQLALSVGLLGLGLVALFVGFALATVRRHLALTGPAGR
jgi:hypothetical protein